MAAPIPLRRAEGCIGRNPANDIVELWYSMDQRWLESTLELNVFKWGQWFDGHNTLPVAYVWMRRLGRGRWALHRPAGDAYTDELRANAETVLETEGVFDPDGFIAQYISPLWQSRK